MKRKITQYSVVMLINSVINILYLLSLKKILDAITTNDIIVFWWFIFMSITITLRYFMRKLELHLRGNYLESTENQLTESFIENSLSYNSKLLYNKSDGDYLSYLSNDIEAYMENSVKIKPLHYVAIMSCSIYVIIAIIHGRIFAIIMIALSILGLLTMKIFSPIQQKKQEDYIKYRLVFVSYIKDYIAGKREIRNYNATNSFMKKFDSVAIEDGRKQRKLNAIKDVTKTFDVVLFYFVVFLNYTVCAYGIYQGQLNVGDMVFLIQLTSGITEYISQISHYKIMINSVKLDENLHSGLINPNAIFVDNIKKIETIELKGVTVNYSDQCILDNVSFTFKQNHSYMIIGKSGSGKSTLLQLLLNLKKDYLGEIYVNDLNIKHIKQEMLYRNISYIPQDSFIFNKSVVENVTFDKSSSINELLKKLNIEYLEEMDLSANGDNISQGERKRIDIARNLWKNTDVLLTDETTASLDLENKLEITNRITKDKEFILISVSHDYTNEMIQMYDYILELKMGKLVEVEKNELYKKA